MERVKHLVTLTQPADIALLGNGVRAPLIFPAPVLRMHLQSVEVHAQTVVAVEIAPVWRFDLSPDRR
jgi:hypothetical protein